jgi:hypothetical protein
MLLVPTKTNPFGSRSNQLQTGEDRNCAEALRPTFDGWGPRI